jgi:hypothetical protein
VCRQSNWNAWLTHVPALSCVLSTGLLPGPGLNVGGWLQFQESVLGYSDPHNNRGAYGMLQGWLDWRDLNPAAVTAFASTAGTAAPTVSAGSANRATIATEGAGVGTSMGGLSVGSAGVQFELSCDSCSLQIDGMTVAGSLGGVETSSCVTPAAVTSAAAASGSSRKDHTLLHLSMLFTTNDVRKARFSVRIRHCSGINSQAGSGEWLPLSAAGANSPPALAVSSAAVAGQAGSTQVYTRGMLCAVRAQPPPAAAAAADGNAAALRDSSVQQRLVFLPADKLREAITITVNTTDDTLLKPSAASNSSSSSSISRAQSLTVDAPQGMFSERAAGGSTNSTQTEAEAAEAAAEAAAREAEEQRRAAQTAAAKAAALAKGISVVDLVPDWVNSLPTDTQYSFSCGCYWNGSWEGNVSVSVSAASGSNGGSSGSNGRAQMYLAGWPVTAKAGRVLGPSDLDVRGYSTLMQRQQLAAGSSSADPLVDAAHLWAAGSFFDITSSSGGGGGSQKGGDESGVSSPASSGVLSANAIWRRRYMRMQQQAVSRTSSAGSSSGSSGSSSLFGLQPIGVLDGVGRRVIMPMAGQHQLLVLQAEGLTADGQVVVLAPGDTSSSSSSMLAPGGSSTKPGNGSAEVLSSWLPGPWDAWVPAG